MGVPEELESEPKSPDSWMRETMEGIIGKERAYANPYYDDDENLDRLRFGILYQMATPAERNEFVRRTRFAQEHPDYEQHVQRMGEHWTELSRIFPPKNGITEDDVAYFLGPRDDQQEEAFTEQIALKDNEKNSDDLKMAAIELAQELQRLVLGMQKAGFYRDTEKNIRVNTQEEIAKAEDELWALANMVARLKHANTQNYLKIDDKVLMIYPERYPDGVLLKVNFHFEKERKSFSLNVFSLSRGFWGSPPDRNAYGYEHPFDSQKKAADKLENFIKNFFPQYVDLQYPKDLETANGKEEDQEKAYVLFIVRTLAKLLEFAVTRENIDPKSLAEQTTIGRDIKAAAASVKKFALRLVGRDEKREDK